MDRYEEDVDARVRGGLSRSSQDRAPLRGACRQQSVERALEHVRGQTARDLHRLPLGGNQQVGERLVGCRLPGMVLILLVGAVLLAGVAFVAVVVLFI